MASRCAAVPLTANLLQRLEPVARRLLVVPPGVVVLGTLGLTAVVWSVLQRVEPFLGHDESVYAGQARAWLTGVPATGWRVYRPLGLPVLGYPPLVLHNGTTAVRLVGLALALLTLVIVYAVGARLTTPRRAAVAVLVVVSGATFLRRLPEFLDDLPSAGLLLAVGYLVLRSRRAAGGRTNRWALPAAAAVATATVLVRYGATAGLLAIAAAALLAWGPSVWLQAWREVTVALAVLLVALAPLAVYSRRVTGSVIGILTRSEASSHRAFLGQGLVYYAEAYPYKLAGVLGAVVMSAALAALAASGRRVWRRCPGGTDAAAAAPTSRDRERLFLGSAAVLELVLLGVVAHGESRFVLFTVLTLTVLGVDAIATAAGSLSRPALTATALVALLAIGLGSVAVAGQVSAATADLRAVGAVAARIPAGPALVPGSRPCLVVSRLAIEAAWTSGCDGADPDDVASLPDVTVYVIAFPGTPGWSGLTRVRALAPGRSWSVLASGPSAALGDAVLVVSAPLRASTPAT